MATCSICKATGTKGFFRFPPEPRRASYLEIAGLPPEKELKVKIQSLRICFRHFRSNAFYFVGSNQLKVRSGKHIQS